MDVVNLTLQGYILGFFPKFRKGRDARDCKPEDTHAAIPIEAPGWSLLWSEQPETLSSEFPLQLATAGSCSFLLRRSPSKRTRSFSSRLHASPSCPPGLRIQQHLLPVQPREITGTKAGSPMHGKHPSQKGVPPSSHTHEDSTHQLFTASLSS